MDDVKVIGQNIRLWRELKGIKAQSLAKNIGISRVTLSSIENGKTDISFLRLKAITKELNIPFKYIFYSPLQLIFEQKDYFKNDMERT